MPRDKGTGRDLSTYLSGDACKVYDESGLSISELVVIAGDALRQKQGGPAERLVQRRLRELRQAVTEAERAKAAI